jgi:hypothetical protein
MTSSSDFADLFAALNAADAEYLLVGAHALAVHGVIRGTKDLDVWVRPSPENAPRVYRALASFGAPLSEVTPTDFSEPGIVFQIGVPPVRIDVTTVIDGVAFEDAWLARVTTRFEGQPVGVLSREHLIANKKAVGRPQDLVDVEHLERGARPPVA